ncbi:MAG: hypothetical protein QW611_04435 [Ignisphaera sp.]
MSLKETITELISMSDEKTVTVLEVPPGTGKTKNSIDVSVELAGKRANILFFLPTHASALTAFAYAINAFYNLYKSTPNIKKLPFIVYYEGVERYCPLYIYKGLFYKALNYARRRWWINRDEYERFSSLGPKDTMRVFGWSVICRKVCPIYRFDINVGNARIFVPKAFLELSNQVLTGEAKTYIKDAVNALAEMSKKGLVKYLNIYMDFDNGIFRGICVRTLLNKAVVKGLKRKIQIFFKGSLIIAPTSGVEFLLKSIVKKLETMNKSKALVMKPIVILDEYDTYFYRPAVMPVFTIRWIEFERNLAKKIIETFKNDYEKGNPFDIDEAHAAIVAFMILDEVLFRARSYLENRRFDLISSSVSLVFDAVAEEIVDDALNVISPFRPRELVLLDAEKFVDFMTRAIKHYISAEKITFIDPNEIKKNFWYYLQLWEWMLIDYCKRHNIPYLLPALYTFTGSEFATAYLERYERHISAAKWVFLVRKKGVPHPKTGLVSYVVAYRAYQTRGTVIIPEKTREVKTNLSVWVIYMISYDCKFYTLFGQDLKLFLTSATGIPWPSDFFKSRSGLIYTLDPYGSSIISYLEGYRYPKPVNKRDRLEYVFEPLVPDPIKKRFVIATSHFKFILKYATLGRVIPELLPHLLSRAESEVKPHKFEYVMSVYSDHLSWLFGDLLRDIRKLKLDRTNLNPSIMILCQRKDIAIRMALESVTIGRYFRFTPKLQICTETKCVDPPRFKDKYIERMLNFMKEIKASHFLVRLKKSTLKNEIKVYVTWFRSKLCRGVDLPDNDILLYTFVVGSPYRPPSTIDFVVWNERPLDALEVYGKAGRVEIQFMLRNTITGTTSTIPLCIACQPVDISEAINELTQAYGRALRKAWNARERGINYVTQLIIPYWLNNKFYGYSPLWMQEIFYIDVKLAVERAIREGEKLRKMKEQLRQQRQQQQQQQSQEASQQQNQQQVQDTSQQQNQQQQEGSQTTMDTEQDQQQSS